MATPQLKTTYSATEVAALEETILKLKNWRATAVKVVALLHSENQLRTPLCGSVKRYA